METVVTSTQLECQPVNNTRQTELFHRVPHRIYKDDQNWIPPLQQDIESIFSPEMNPYFEHGDAQRWILTNQEGELCGRIAAFVNYNKIEHLDLPTGGIGFFECINEWEAAYRLFDQAEQWLLRHGVRASEAPINFGENHEYWGLLVKGFTRPSYGMNYNPPYYRDLFESYGFTPAYRQYTNELDLTKQLPDRFAKVAQRVAQKPQYEFVPFRKKYLDSFADDFCAIYNKAWQFHEKFAPMEKEYVKKNFRKMEPIIDENLIWFVYAHEQPAGFLLAIPDINLILQYLDGTMNWWNKLKFLWYRYWYTIDRAKVFIMGVIPEYQEKGLEAGLAIRTLRKIRAQNRYKEVELSWVGDFNPKMLSLHKASGAYPIHEHITFYKEIF